MNIFATVRVTSDGEKITLAVESSDLPQQIISKSRASEKLQGEAVSKPALAQ